MPGLKTGIAGGTAMLAILAVMPPSWRASQADAIRQAVLEATLEHPQGPRRHPDRVVCVEIWSGPTWMSRPGVAEDPSPMLLAQLQHHRALARPQSECDASDRGVMHRPTRRQAVIIGVARAEWVSSDFVRVEGGWFYNGVNAVGWKYTLSFHDGLWTVDTEKFLWVS